MVCLQGKTISQVAREMYVSHSTVERFLHLYYTTGEVKATQQKHGPDRLLDDFEQLTVLQSFLSKPGIYLKEVQEELYDATGKWASCATICRTVQRIGLTRQKMKRVAIGRSDVLRGQYMADIDVFDPNMLVFVDETGFDRRNLIRQFGYGLRGITPVTHQLLVYGQRISAIGVMTTRGIEDFYLIEGSVNGDIFLNFVQRCLLSIMLPFDGDNPRSVLVMDNAAIHHVEVVTDLLTAAGILIRFLPPYSPDLNPIQEAFSKVKAYVKDNEIAYQSTQNPRLLVSSAFASITSHDCNQYIRHAGYTD